MVGNLAKVEQRMGTVETASKITTAMKLVSLSKLQKYKRLSESVQAFTQAYGEIPSESYQGDDKPTLTVCLLPDLGLATAYTQGLLHFIGIISGLLHGNPSCCIFSYLGLVEEIIQLNQ